MSFKDLRRLGYVDGHCIGLPKVFSEWLVGSKTFGLLRQCFLLHPRTDHVY